MIMAASKWKCHSNANCPDLFVDIQLRKNPPWVYFTDDIPRLRRLLSDFCPTGGGSLSVGGVVLGMDVGRPCQCVNIN